MCFPRFITHNDETEITVVYTSGTLVSCENICLRTPINNLKLLCLIDGVCTNVRYLQHIGSIAVVVHCTILKNRIEHNVGRENTGRARKAYS